MSESDTDITVIIATQDRAESLPMLLGHLELQTYPQARFDILLVHTGSDPETPRTLERYAEGGPVRVRRLAAAGESLNRARNRAIAQATGRWLLFLDDDLLASEQLVAEHVAAQRACDGAAAVVGPIEPHPQLDPQTFTRTYALAASRMYIPNQPLRFLDWRLHNLSLPRAAVVEAGGFDEALPIAGLDGVELGWRLEQSGLTGTFRREACAYVWHAVRMEEERARFYAEGYALRYVLQKTASELLHERYAKYITPWRGRLRRAAAPLCGLACALSAGGVARRRLLCRHAFAEALGRGYRDAAAGRDPRGT